MKPVPIQLTPVVVGQPVLRIELNDLGEIGNCVAPLVEKHRRESALIIGEHELAAFEEQEKRTPGSAAVVRERKFALAAYAVCPGRMVWP